MISERKYKEERNKVNMKKLAKEEFNKSLSKLTEQCSENQTVAYWQYYMKYLMKIEIFEKPFCYIASIKLSDKGNLVPYFTDYYLPVEMSEYVKC